MLTQGYVMDSDLLSSGSFSHTPTNQQNLTQQGRAGLHANLAIKKLSMSAQRGRTGYETYDGASHAVATHRGTHSIDTLNEALQCHSSLSHGFTFLCLLRVQCTTPLTF